MYAYGASQTGRMLRSLIHSGFTTDEQGRRALDAVSVHIGGASLGLFNGRFSQPNEGGFFTSSWFPFRYETTQDPATGRRDGLGARIPAGVQPKIFLVDSSSEDWDRGRVGALNHTSLDGQQDVPLADNVRAYLMAGAQHGAGTFPPPTTRAQLKGNVLDQRILMRALMVAFDEWVRTGKTPPPSRHPTLADGTLVAQGDIKFPEVRGVQWPYNVPGAYRSDLTEPWTDHPLPFLVPQVDRDGNETGGIRLPDVAVPLATHTGWAFRSERVGSPDELLFLTGSYIPFARTRAEREQNGDTRLSIEERYSGLADYRRRIEESARGLVEQRHLLAEDVQRVVDRAVEHWNLLMGGGSAMR